MTKEYYIYVDETLDSVSTCIVFNGIAQHRTCTSGQKYLACTLPLALEHVKADKKNSHAQSCVYVCPMSPTIKKSENNVQVVMIRSD